MSQEKNIVILLDGTANQISENISNVLKLYRIVPNNSKQVVFYDQGVGTLRKTYTWGRFSQYFKVLIGQAFGYGLDRNVLKAYRFIVRHYSEYKTADNTQKRDQIFIFGFSRGAHTARVLAGLLYEVGLLGPEQLHLSDSALMAYKQSIKKPRSAAWEVDSQEESAGINFRRVMRTKSVSVRFLGLFDTVSSVYIPNPSGIFPPFVSEKLPHTSTNPNVRTVRHAMSIDERRRMFRLDRWNQNQTFQPIQHSVGSVSTQSVKEVWFSGFHSDIGGGLDRIDSGLSQIPLIWILEEAENEGLHVYRRMADYVTGKAPYSKNTKYLYPKAKPTAKAHNSMSKKWWVFEIIPKQLKYIEWPKSGKLEKLGLYFPLEEPRKIMPKDQIHGTVEERLAEMSEYRPINLKFRFKELFNKTT